MGLDPGVRPTFKAFAVQVRSVPPAGSACAVYGQFPRLVLGSFGVLSSIRPAHNQIQGKTRNSSTNLWNYLLDLHVLYNLLVLYSGNPSFISSARRLGLLLSGSVTRFYDHAHDWGKLLEE